MHLYINTYGVYTHVKDKMFEFRVPDKSKGTSTKHHFSAKKVHGIIYCTPGAISTEAVHLAMRNQVDIIFSSRDGTPQGRVWHSHPGSTTRIRKRQLEASLNHIGLQWTVHWVSQKMQYQANKLRKLQKHRKSLRSYLAEREVQIGALQKSVSALKDTCTTTDESASTIRGIEGTAGRLYFQAISKCMPPRYSFEGRSYRPAQDPFNAVLNYCYGILYSRIEKALLIAGIDPYLGFMHRDDYNQKSMVFDFIEPYRHWSDQVAFQLFSSKKANNTMFEKLAGGVGLTKTGKEIIVTQMLDYLDGQKIHHAGRRLSRSRSLLLDAHHFANTLIGKKEYDFEIKQL